jgi:hypothetical protein
MLSPSTNHYNTLYPILLHYAYRIIRNTLMRIPTPLPIHFLNARYMDTDRTCSATFFVFCVSFFFYIFIKLSFTDVNHPNLLLIIDIFFF